MRPLLLEMAGIGPFADTQRIEFSAMDARALFLIHGPTGQGKSFIFDALCYALYSDTPAGREGHMKSDFLPDGVEPWIRLRFALGEDIYEVRRSLPYNRPKKTGSGFTLVPEAQELTRRNPDGSLQKHLASKKTEVNRVLNRLMGLDAPQFRQVVMIPQGEFRKLLLSESGDREALLERLFDTRVYRDVQERLKNKEDEANLDERSRSLHRDQLVKELTDLWRNENLLFSLSDEDPFTGRMEEAAAVLTERAASLAEAARVAADLRDRAVSECVRVEHLHADHLQKMELEQTLFVLAGREAAMESLKARLEIDRRALALKDRYAQLLDTRLSEDTSGSEHRAAVIQLEAARKSRTELEVRATRAEAWRERRDLLRKRVNLLTGFRDEEKQRNILRNSRNSAEGQLEKARTTQVGWRVRNQEVQKGRSLLDREIESLETRGSAEDKQRQTGLLEFRLSLTEELDQLTGRIRVVNELVEDRLRLRDGAAEELEQLKNRREANMAGELAAGLKENQPCPVCGSTHHPRPHQAGTGPSPEQFAAAEEVLSSAVTALNEARSDQGSLQGQIQALKEKLVPSGDEIGADVMRRRIQELTGEVNREKELRQERDRLLSAVLPALSKESEGLTGEIERFGEEVRSLTRQMAEHETAWDSAMLQWPPDGSEGPPDPGDLPEHLKLLGAELLDIEKDIETLEQERGNVMEHFKSCESAEDVRRVHWMNAQNHRNLKEGEFVKGFTDAGFPDEKALVAALEAAVNSDTDNAELTNWETRRTQASTLLADTVKRIDGRADPDPLAYRKSRDEAIAADVRAAASLSDFRTLSNRLDNLESEYRKLEQDNRDQEGRNALLRRLSEQVRGVRTPKISLNRYFLARRLEEVLVQATRRLSLLSRGRFVLKRRDEGRSAAAQAGLDLLVSDAWTGTERPVNTLSGGQLFMASLSLALGLADVVQARSGGVRLEALFIDEGFGTLDDDALQGVLAVLNDLRENRMVGVISHVPELKRQIADRIEVSAAGAGSKITTTRGD